MKNLISVIIPVYNTAETLPWTLASVRAQTYQNFEIIIVDDGSDEVTKAFLMLENNMPKTEVYFLNENHGVSYARNVGLKRANGDYICFLDSDDTYEPDFFESMLKECLDAKADSVYCGYAYFKMGKLPTSKIYTLPDNQKNPLLSYLKLGDFHFSGMLTKRDFLEKNQISFDVDKRLAEDIMFTIKILMHGKTSCINRPLFKYHYRGNSTTKCSHGLNYYRHDVTSLMSIYSYLLENYKGADKNEILFLAERRVNDRLVTVMMYLLISFDFNQLREFMHSNLCDALFYKDAPLSASRRRAIWFVKGANIFKLTLGFIYYRFIRRPCL